MRGKYQKRSKNRREREARERAQQDEIHQAELRKRRQAAEARLESARADLIRLSGVLQDVADAMTPALAAEDEARKAESVAAVQWKALHRLVRAASEDIAMAVAHDETRKKISHQEGWVTRKAVDTIVKLRDEGARMDGGHRDDKPAAKS